MINHPDKCPFCNLDSDRNVLCKSQYAYAIYDKYPVSKGHVLVIPVRHCPDFFDLNEDEQADCLFILNTVKKIIENTFSPDGYNVGININEHAGQTIPHAHIHLIPRYKGDVESPRGGIRGVIPDKRDY